MLGVGLEVGVLIGSGYGVIVGEGSAWRVPRTTAVMVPAEMAKIRKSPGPMIKNSFFNMLPPRPIKGPGQEHIDLSGWILSSTAHKGVALHRRILSDKIVTQPHIVLAFNGF